MTVDQAPASTSSEEAALPGFPKNCRACKGAQQLLDAFSRFSAKGGAHPDTGRQQEIRQVKESQGHDGPGPISPAASHTGPTKAGTHTAAVAAAAATPAPSSSPSAAAAAAAGHAAEAPGPKLPCPPTSGELGGNAWAFLHTTAAYYPDAPTHAQQALMRSMMEGLAEFYPCSYCAEHLREQFQRSPPDVASGGRLSLWLCRIHNEVNEMVGKPAFDCSRVMERWRDGPADGSCDD